MREQGSDGAFEHDLLHLIRLMRADDMGALRPHDDVSVSHLGEERHERIVRQGIKPECFLDLSLRLLHALGASKTGMPFWYASITMMMESPAYGRGRMSRNLA